MDELYILNAIKRAVRKEENYQPRSYQTVGGMWTVDTWKFEDVIYQLIDEGYTDRIFVKDLGLDVVVHCDDTIKYNNGDINKLKEALLMVSYKPSALAVYK
jgi:hypothetical protein